MSQTTSEQSFEVPLFITIPHSGERVPPQTPWLQSLPETILMSDVDRYVDVLYRPALEALNIPYQTTEWHRYAVDLNRQPEDIDASSVQGATRPAGAHADGYHWVMTKNEVQLMPHPMSFETHQELTHLIYDPFHQKIRDFYQQFKKTKTSRAVYHIDAHSMPSLGTRMHKDPGELRADIVISDCLGKSCSSQFRDLVIAAYVTAGFKVGYNWPYVGGKVTEQYGRPQLGQHVLQVELNRSLYMDEVSKKIKQEHVKVQNKILKALTTIKSELAKISEHI